MADYLTPMASEMPDIDVAHVQTPTSISELGAKGVGESGTGAAPDPEERRVEQGGGDDDPDESKQPVSRHRIGKNGAVLVVRGDESPEPGKRLHVRRGVTRLESCARDEWTDAMERMQRHLAQESEKRRRIGGDTEAVVDADRPELESEQPCYTGHDHRSEQADSSPFAGSTVRGDGPRRQDAARPGDCPGTGELDLRPEPDQELIGDDEAPGAKPMTQWAHRRLAQAERPSGSFRIGSTLIRTSSASRVDASSRQASGGQVARAGRGRHGEPER